APRFPAAGFWAITTVPVAELAVGCVTVRTVNPTRARTSLACSSVLPTTSGTTRSGLGPGPSDTLIRTGGLASEAVPADGRWLSTSPRGRLDATGYESAR